MKALIRFVKIWLFFKLLTFTIPFLIFLDILIEFLIARYS